MTQLFVLQSVEVLKDADAVKQLGNILKTNVRACKSLGHPYLAQVIFLWSGIRVNLLRFYRYSLLVSVIGLFVNS